MRPAGLALSVHQGKGSTALAAKIGALCEAMESHCGENAPADGPRCSFKALPEGERAPELADYAVERTERLHRGRAIQWCSARDVVSGKPHYLPHHLVSLDFTGDADSCFERSSAGMGAGTSEDEAVQTALLEQLERDAVGEWERSPPLRKMAASLDLDSVPVDWFQTWRERLRAFAVELDVYAFTSMGGLPVFVCVIEGQGEFGADLRVFSGSSANGDPERALFKALAEAIQSRLTVIAAVRDDLLPSRYGERAASPWGLALPIPPGFPQRIWEEIEPVPSDWRSLAERLVERGYRQVVVKRLDDGELPVVKAFVPGLGSLSRARRAPL